MAAKDENLFIRAGEQVVQAGVEAARLTSAAAHAVEDAVGEVKRLAKRSRHVAEDLMDDATHRIKRDPLRSIAFGFAVGASVGILTGWLATRNHRY